MRLFGGQRSGEISPVFPTRAAVLFHEHRVTSEHVISVAYHFKKCADAVYQK